MTARHDIRVGARSRERDDRAFDSQRAPNVGELLLVAREKKGVTLERAERDTKIRARHLAALENGAAADLPAPVYAKGFLRNYALYLGLDADEMVMRWRTEQDLPRPSQPIAVAPPPQPIASPRRGLLFTPGVLVAALLTLVVVAFVGYVGLQLVRFSQNPEVLLEGPSVVELAPDARVLVLRGGGTPLAVVSVHGADDLLRTATADDRGRWSVELPVSKGRNDFSVVARDPQTGRETPPLQVIATVAVSPSATPKGPTSHAPDRSSTATMVPGTTSPSAALGLYERDAAVLALSEPAAGLVARQGKVRIAGATDAGSVLVSSQPVGGTGDRTADAPAPLMLLVSDGAFSGRLTLPEGRWEVTVETLEPDGRVPAVVARRVYARYDGLVVTVGTRDRHARIRITLDGEVADVDRLDPGETRSYRAIEEVIVHTGNRQATYVTSNGRSLGSMGEGAGPETWRLEKGKPPTRIR